MIKVNSFRKAQLKRENRKVKNLKFKFKIETKRDNHFLLETKIISLSLETKVISNDNDSLFL